MNPQLDEILNLVADWFGVKSAEILSTERFACTVEVRYVAFFLARESTDFSFYELGKYFARHHATVIHGVNQVRARILRDPEFARQIEILRSRVTPKEDWELAIGHA